MFDPAVIGLEDSSTRYGSTTYGGGGGGIGGGVNIFSTHKNYSILCKIRKVYKNTISKVVHKRVLGK